MAVRKRFLEIVLMNEPVAILSAVEKAYQMDAVTVPVLRGIDLLIRPSRFTVLLGPSGSGKTGLQPENYETGRIERIDPVTGAVTRLYDSCNGQKLRGPNDIVFDAAGGFYFTDLGKSRARDRDWGGLYYAKPDGTAIT